MIMFVVVFQMLNVSAMAGLVAAWSFDEESGDLVLDHSGNYNTGIIRGAVNRDAGKQDKAICFKGTKSNNFIEVSDSDDLRLKGPFTIELWWMHDNNQNTQVLFRKGDLKQEDLNNYHAFYSSEKIHFRVTDCNMNSHVVSSKLSSDGWHLLDFVYDGTSIRIYVDKNQAASKEIGNAPLMADIDDALYIGSFKDQYPWSICGRMDEFRIYDQALNPDGMGRQKAERNLCDIAPVPESFIRNILKYLGFKGGKLALARAGQPNAAIVIKKGYSELQSIPAKELQRYIQKIANVRLPIIEDDFTFGGNMILVGESRYTRDLGIDAEKLEGDSYIIRSFPKRLALVGHDDKMEASKINITIPDPLKECGDEIFYDDIMKTTKNGTLNAVYAFLQDYCGIQWLMPGELGECIPRKNSLKVNEINVIGKPCRLYAFSGRWFNQEWAGKNFFGKSAGAFVFDPVHTWSWLIPAEKYYDSHPEWFAMRDGKRIKKESLCVSNKEMRAEALKNLTQIYSQGFEMVSLLQSDGYKRCQCSDCEAMDNYRGDPCYVPGCPADRIWVFHDFLAREIQKIYPEKKVIIYSYGPTGEIPGKIPKLADNVRIATCINITEVYQPLMERWKKYHPYRCSAYVYWFTLETHNNFPQSYSYIAGELKKLVPYGADGFYFCGGGKRWGYNAPIYYMIARLLRDPDLNPNVIMEDFCRGLFENAADPMNLYFNTLYRGTQRGLDHCVLKLKNEQLADRTPKGEQLLGWNIPPQDLYLISYPDETLKSCEHYLNQARKLADNRQINKRIEFFADAFTYLKLTTQGFKLLRESEASDWSKKSMQQLMNVVSLSTHRHKYANVLFC